jgi:UDP-2,4-diacetamido-2,4,6-trideoxy-beta-L-altropyranose hydrolase
MGHLERCLTLSAALARRGVEVTFAMHAPGDRARERVAVSGHALRVLENAKDELAIDAGIIIVDGYGFDTAYQRALRGANRVVCVIDDLASAPIAADVVLNGNFYGAELAYDAPGAKMLVGPSYALVREEIVFARHELTPRGAADPPRVFVTMGGADPTAETEKIIASLASLPPIEVRVAVGSANPRREEIERAARASSHRVEVLFDVRDMGAQMAWCDVAVSAAGGTCLELACVGVAAVVMPVADNQRLVADAVARLGLMTTISSADAAGKAVSALLSNPEGRARIEESQRACVDGEGARRAAEALLGA